MVEVIEMTASTMDKIREQVDALDFETGFDPDERLSPEERAEGIAEELNVTRELAEDQHLAYRATAAFFAERANEADSFVMDALHKVVEHKSNNGDLILVNCNASVGVLVENGDIRAKVNHKGKMPIVTLLRGSPESLKRDVVAKYRYNPKSDKLQRIG